MTNKKNLITILCSILLYNIEATENTNHCPISQSNEQALQPHYLSMYKEYLIPSSTEKEDAQYIDAFNTLKRMLNQRTQCCGSIKQAKQASRDFNRVFEDYGINNKDKVFIKYLISHFPRKLTEIRNIHCGGSGPIPNEFLKETLEDIKLCIKNINENKPLEQWDFRLFEDIIYYMHAEGYRNLRSYGWESPFSYYLNERAKEIKSCDCDQFDSMASKLLETIRSLDTLIKHLRSEHKKEYPYMSNALSYRKFVVDALKFMEFLQLRWNREMAQEQSASSSNQ